MKYFIIFGRRNTECSQIFPQRTAGCYQKIKAQQRNAIQVYFIKNELCQITGYSKNDADE